MSGDVTPADDLSEFISSFYEECSDLLSSIDRTLSGADREVPTVEGLNDVFRAVHTIKGSGGFFGVDPIVDFAHVFETLLGAAREGQLSDKSELGRLLVEGADVLARVVDLTREGKAPPQDLTQPVVSRIEAFLAANGGSARSAKLEDDPNGAYGFFEVERRSVLVQFRLADTVKDAAHMEERLVDELRRLGTVSEAQPTGPLAAAGPCRAVLLETTEPDGVIRAVFDFVEHDLDIRDVASDGAPSAGSTPEAAQAEDREAERGGQKVSKAKVASTTIRVDLARVDRLVNMVGELVITQAMLTQQMADQEAGNRQQLRQGHEELANYTRELQECVMAIRMQPVRSVFSRIPRLVREISAKLGKKVRLVMSGESTEIDKTVVEELADPLLHMIRNAIDHGIEDVEKRRAAGKPDEGFVELAAMQRGGNILITLTDDGAGIDRQRIRKKAVERGIIAHDANLSGEDIDHLIFAPGFSTAEQVTDVSGRGVGMDVVLSKITNLGGRIQISSTLGRGTRFTLVLPLTLAVLDGMLVSVARETYILPLTNIVETIRPEKRSVRHLANGASVVAIRGEFIRLVNLGELFGLSGAIREPWKALVVVVELDSGHKLGVIVDELIGQRQVVVKSLQENFDPVPGISGATILGTGRVALILDIEQLERLGRRSAVSLESVEIDDLVALAEPSSEHSTPAHASQGVAA